MPAYDAGVRLVVILAVSWALAACDDDDPPCGPAPGPLPTGKLGDPYNLPLPDDCLRCGVDRLAGHWFAADLGQPFYYWYPRFEGSGIDLRRSINGRLVGWSDGSVYFERTAYSGGVFARAYCARGDDTIAGVEVVAGDTETTVTRLVGTRFEPRVERSPELVFVGYVRTGVPILPVTAFDLVVDGGFAYVAGPGGLAIIDVRDPTAPVNVGIYGGDYNDIVVVHGDGRTVAYLAPLRGPPTMVLDVTDPQDAVLSALIPEYSHTLFHTTRDGGSQLYLATYTNDIPVFDVSHPTSPVRIGTTRAPGPEAGIHDMFVDGDQIYANNTTAGLVAFDVSRGLDHPVKLGQIATSYSHTSVVGTAGGRRVVLHGDEGMTGAADGAAFLRILDGDPASRTFLTELARYQSRRSVGIHNFQLVGDRLYIAYYQDGVRVLDLSNPARPREVAHFNTWDPASPGSTFEGALGIQVVGDLIYVADDLRGLVILRDPAASR